MNILYGTYALISGGLFLACFPIFLLYALFKGRYGEGLKERLGYIHHGLTQSLTGSPRIWIHAVSLGEIKAAESIINSLKNIIPGCSIILSTTTGHGRDLANNIFREKVPVIYSPIDFIVSVRKALENVRPDVLVLMETEIWPAWINEARRMGVKIAMVNGRISSRSYNKYLIFRTFFQTVLRNIDIFSMITEEDRMRIASLGADPDKITVNGNAKYDLLSDSADPSIEPEMRRILNLEDHPPVFIAGSTRTGEESMIIYVYKRIIKEFPDTVLIIAPRHIDRTGEIASLLEKYNLRYQLRSELDNNSVKRVEQVVIIDRFGELFKLYSVGTIIYCGASLVPLGGQNPLEAAVWGKATLYGPYMEDFLDAKSLLDANDSGIQVSSPEMLEEKVIGLLKDPDLLKNYGARAREAVLRNRSAGERHARIISDLIYRDKK
ncbi:MAG TPA: 3-deoxy-D-manno-octulosonic acid transferase [Desulfatiglandales bacterium]|nr:3-deoxy-D-manno-octulosonic acid transferase [Desulfatiglandales bacterium]